MKRVLLIFFVIPVICFSQTQINAIILGDPDIKSFGNSVAISSNGNIVAVGAPGVSNDSYVRVYKNENGSWVQIGNDIENDGILERVGSGVAISDDGTIVAVGARQAGDLDKGHVRIYKNENGTWSKIGNDIIGEANFDESGSSVSLSSDGTIVAIGAPFNDVNGSKSGHVRVYKNENGTWTQIGGDIDGDAAGNEFGKKIDLSSDGTIIAIGAYLFNGNKGQVKIFKNVNNVWTQQGNDIVGEVGGDYIGYDVSLSNNGLTLATFDSRGNNANPQHVRIFKFENNIWIPKGNPISVVKTNSIDGSISISGDGNIIVFGQNSKKKIATYKFENNDWIKKGNDINSITSFGFDVSLSDDGNTVVSGIPSADHSGQNNNGAASVWDLSGVLKINSFVNQNSKIYPNPIKNTLNLELSNNLQLNRLNIYNLLGQKMISENKKSVNLSTLTKGIYLLEIITDKGKTTKKIIKN